MHDNGRLRSFLGASGWEDAVVTKLAGDASTRQFHRVSRPGSASAIVMDAGEDTGSANRFLKLSPLLGSAGLSAPRIIFAAPERGMLLVEDFGDDLFGAALERNPGYEGQLYETALAALVRFRDLDSSILPSRTADNLAQMIEPGLDHYFGVPSAKQPGIIRILAAALERISPPRLSFVHRDFHVENLIWLSERRGVARAGLIDFQDAFLGDPIYDLASLVTDARRDVGEALRDRMIRDYANETEQSHDAVADRVALFGIQRNLRILGIFTWLGAVPHKSRYLALVPRVRAYLDRDLMHPAAREVRTALTPYLELKATAARGAES